MQLVDQTKTVHGRIPVKAVRLEDADEGLMLCFALEPPSAIAQEQAAVREGKTRKHREPAVADIALLWEEGNVVDRNVLMTVAKRIGPLFGQSDRELVSDWLAASLMARNVLSVQEAVNGSVSLELIDAMYPETERTDNTDEPKEPTENCSAENERKDDCFTHTQAASVAKTVARNTQTGNRFTLYNLSIEVPAGASETYFATMPAFPHFKKFVAHDAYDYVFMDVCDEQYKDEDVPRHYVEITLFSFAHEISFLDFVAAMEACGGAEGEEAVSLWHRLAREEGLAAGEVPKGFYGLASGASGLQVREAHLEESDRRCLQKLVHAVVSLNLQGIQIDVFRSAEADDFMTFSTYLSYLWYCQAKQLDQVRIGYCAVCGRGFSLTGHRGIERNYCSEACKTKAKNARVRKQTEEARRLFLEEGLSVVEVAQRVYAEELSGNVRANKRKTLTQAQQRVRKVLKSYPAFKHELDRAVELGDVTFVRRCIEEGIVTKKDIEERKRHLSA